MSEKAKETEMYFGKDCPVGKVQVEFVGCHGCDGMHSRHGWKPADSAFLDVYVDGVRYRIDLGDIKDGSGKTIGRGMHICGPFDLVMNKTSINAGDVYLPVKENT